VMRAVLAVDCCPLSVMQSVCYVLIACCSLFVVCRVRVAA